MKKTFSITPRGKKLTFFSISDMKKQKKPFYFLFNDIKIKKWTILEDDKNLKKKNYHRFFLLWGNKKSRNNHTKI